MIFIINLISCKTLLKLTVHAVKNEVIFVKMGEMHHKGLWLLRSIYVLTILPCILWLLWEIWPQACWHPLPRASLGIWSTWVWCLKKRALSQQSRIRLCFQELSGLALFPSHHNAPANTLWASFHTASSNTQNIQPKYHVSSVWPLGTHWHKFTS